MIKRIIGKYLAGNLKDKLLTVDNAILTKAEEIRIRCGKPIIIRFGQASFTVEYLPSCEDIELTVSKMSDYSVYAFNDEIKRGFLTLQGGSRVGLCGSVVYKNGEIFTLRDISSLNIRISRQVKGCADEIMQRLYKDGFVSTLIVSPPACGKTTLLRDVVRQLSDGGVRIALVDERGEVAGTYLGKAQNDVGKNTDVLDGCQKTDGMYMLLRSMSPQIIAVDEIGAQCEINCIRQIVNSGVDLLCTVHAANTDELMGKPLFKAVIGERLFKRYVFLCAEPSVGAVKNIYDEEMRSLCI